MSKSTCAATEVGGRAATSQPHALFTHDLPGAAKITPHTAATALRNATVCVCATAGRERVRTSSARTARRRRRLFVIYGLLFTFRASPQRVPGGAVIAKRRIIRNFEKQNETKKAVRSSRTTVSVAAAF